MKRAAWWAVGLGVLLWGCGRTDDLEPEVVDPPPVACEPTSCQDAGKNCGTMPDGCGGTLTCGTCGDGQTCGGGGEANVCGSGSSCTPTTCAVEGKNCGVISDGCGGTLTCGTCGHGQTCGGRGEANVCGGGGGSCTPTTCEAAGKTCGDIPDGCGGTLTCGTCGDGQTCSSDNVCVTPPAGSAGWLKLLSTEADERFTAIAADERGGLVAAMVGGAERLARYDARGNRSWARPGADEDTSYHGLSAKPDGSGFFAEGHTSRMHGGNVVHEFSKSGELVRRHLEWNGEANLWAVVAGDEGGYAYSMTDLMKDSIVSISGSGERHALTVEHGQVYFQELARDPDGNLVVGGMVYDRLEWNGHAFGHDGEGGVVFFAKLTPEAEVLWVRQFDVAGDVAGIATSARGTVVAAVSFGRPTSVAGKTVEGPTLIALERDGAVRWANDLPGDFLHLNALAVLPEGEAVVVSELDCKTSEARRYQLTGAQVWSHTLRTETCTPDRDGRASHGVSVTGAAFVGSDVVISGYFVGNADFGDGRKATSKGHDGFLLNLGR